MSDNEENWTGKVDHFIFDACVFLNYMLIEESTNKSVDSLFDQLFTAKITVLIPDLCFYEVIYNLKKKQYINEDVIELLDAILSLDNLIVYKLDAKEYKNVLMKASKHDVSTYDAAYAYLHWLFPSWQIVTFDKRFYNAMSIESECSICLKKVGE